MTPSPRDDTLTRPEVEARISELLGQMTVPEKVGQLWQVPPVEFERMDGSEAVWRERPGLADDLRSGRIGSLLNLADPAKVNEYQRIAVQESRLGIPLLIGSDVIHGFRTVFPIPLAESCTWNPDLLEQAAQVAATEASAVGIDWTFAPMVDIARDPRWGRVAEGSGEDVYLTGVLAAARVRGFQAELPTGRRVASCPKHYVGYGAAEAGRDYNTVDVSERTLRDVYLPPFKVAFDAGAGSVMTSFNELSGIPATANAFTLRTVLRGEWGWPGVTLSDYESVKEMIAHGSAADLRDAARQSITAGLDIEMVSDAYDQHLPGLIEQGEVDGALLDEAVRRVLRLKFSLGLFEQPYVDEEQAESFQLQGASRELALEVAQQSVVLLKNEGNVLPLQAGTGRVAVIGPLADQARALLGCWTIFGKEEETDTILHGLQSYRPDLVHVRGCAVKGGDTSGIAEAVQAASAADVVILVIGEDDHMSGEARSRTDLGLPGAQQELADAVIATGTPVVTVLLSGRPLVIPALAEGSAALLAAWHGGTMAGQAVADVLYGKISPSGRLTMGWPRHVGQLPLTYAHKTTGRPDSGEGVTQFGEPFKSRYIDRPNSPLFPFGFGLTYGRFEYGNLRVLTPSVTAAGTVQIEVDLQNTGSRPATEVAQLYVRDLVGSVTRPVRELKGFQRVELAAGEKKTLHFDLKVADLGFWRADHTHGVEPGKYHVFVGPDADASLQGQFLVEDKK